MRGDDDAVVDARPYLVKDAITYAVLCCTSLLGLRKKRHVLPQQALAVDAERGGFAVVDVRFTVADQLTNKPEREAVPAAGAYRFDPARSIDNDGDMETGRRYHVRYHRVQY